MYILISRLELLRTLQNFLSGGGISLNKLGLLIKKYYLKQKRGMNLMNVWIHNTMNMKWPSSHASF